MKVLFLQNTIFSGRRYPAGASAEVPDDVAEKMVKAALAYAEKTIEAPAAEEPVKPAPRRTRQKAVPK